MTENGDHQDGADLPPEDKMGFAVPKTPTHSLMLLNSYMRTDMLQHIHLRLLVHYVCSEKFDMANSLRLAAA